MRETCMDSRFMLTNSTPIVTHFGNHPRCNHASYARKPIGQRHQQMLRRITSKDGSEAGNSPLIVQNKPLGREENKLVNKHTNSIHRRQFVSSNEASPINGEGNTTRVIQDNFNNRRYNSFRRADSRGDVNIQHQPTPNIRHYNVEEEKKSPKASVSSLNSPMYKSQKISSQNLSQNKKLLKNIIKGANGRFIEEMERSYSLANKKHSNIALVLAKTYIEGKRVEQNLPRAIEILSNSTLPEAKFMLVKIAFDQQNFCDVYHYIECYFNFKCCCLPTPTKKSTSHGVQTPNLSIASLEQNKSKCYKHLCESLKAQIIGIIGEKEARKCYLEGSKLSFNVQIYPSQE